MSETPTNTVEAAPSEDDGWEWGIVEVFGHRRHAGRVREEERFGSKMMRIEVPVKGDPAQGWTTRYYGGGSIFSYTPSDEASVLRANRPYDPPARLTYCGDEDEGGDDDF